jgi:Xaa-Pro aminopeptidase
MTSKIIAALPQFPVAPRTSAISYLSRLNRLWEKMADNSVCILVSNPECKRSNDTHYPYRQSSEIVYLNGFPEPNSVLIVSKLGGKQNVIMLVQEKDKTRETWDGIRFGMSGAKKNFFANEAFAIGRFDEVIGELLGKAEAVYYRFGRNKKFDKQFRKLWEKKQKTLLNPSKILDELRLYKNAEELEIIRHSSKIAAEAHKQAMQICRPGLRESQLQAVLEFIFTAGGAVAPAYGSIVAAGNNACVLHYVENQSEIKNGDLVLIDAGCEFGSRAGGYASDITRTFPANGKFSQPQRELYELVLKAQMAGIATARPGVPLIQVQRTCERILRQGLRKMGILREKQQGEKQLAFKDLLPHGTSHWMGIDVHDVGSYDDASKTKSVSPKQRVLEPGMVFTIEPGLYISKTNTLVPKRYRGIGIRIEDDVVITNDGCEVLTAEAPKTVAEIEALMSQKS